MTEENPGSDISPYVAPGLPKRMQNTRITMPFIVDVVAAYFDLEVEQMLARNRKTGGL